MKTATNKRERMYQAIQNHGEQLNAIFNTGLEPITLCKKLLRIERAAHQLATDYCNGADGITTENFDIYADTILLSVDRVLNHLDKKIPLFLNPDARGYALKIEEKYMRDNNIKLHQDWGGYGIIAPDFNN